MRRLALVLAVLVVPSAAQAFCGFYVSDSGKQLLHNATQVALMREGTRTALSMQNEYEGPTRAVRHDRPGAGGPPERERQDAAS